MENIKLRARLSAYTRGILPSKLSELDNDIDAPQDGFIYARKDGEWINLNGTELGDRIELLDNSGLNLEKENNVAKIGIRQKTLIDSEIPNDYQFEEDMVYYIVDTTPNLYINGGTAFSDEHEDYILGETFPSEYKNIIFGGNRNPSVELELQPLNSKGVLYNG